jgi:outer membrane protein assembly factor BamB
VVGDAGGLVVAIDLETGESAWEASHEGSIRGGLAGDGEHVFVVSQGGDVAAYDKGGERKWKRTLTRPKYGGGGSTPVEGYAAPVIDGSRLFVPFARDTYYDSPALVALSVEDGAELWRGQPARSVDHWGNLRSSPALADGKLVFAEPYSGDIAALLGGTGELAYRVTVGESRFPQYASPAIAGNTAYVPRHDGHLYAIDVSTGAVRWSMYLGRHESAGKKAPDLAPDRPFDGWASDDALYAPPAIGPDGTVYVGSGDGYLYAVGSDAAKQE